MPLSSNPVVFANPGGQNENCKSFLELCSNADATPTVVSLAEKLPAYAELPNPGRKARLEEIIQHAANTEAQSLCGAIGPDSKPTILSGRFPAAVTDWVAATDTDLFVKQPIAADGSFGNASKGDIKLIRTLRIPSLLLSQPVERGGKILVGMARKDGSPRAKAFCSKILSWAKKWAEHTDGKLVLFHAWEVIGETHLMNQLEPAAVEAERQVIANDAQAYLKSLVAEHKLESVVDELVTLKGDPLASLLERIEKTKPSLVVLGSDAKEGLAGALLGNTAEAVLRHSCASVLIVRQ